MLKISVQPYRVVFFSQRVNFVLVLVYRTIVLYLQYYTCVTDVTYSAHVLHMRQQENKCSKLFEIIVDIILFWIYFANKMCFKFYYSVWFCYNETQCLHAVFALRIKEFISFLIVVCDILFIYDYHACFYVGYWNCMYTLTKNLICLCSKYNYMYVNILCRDFVLKCKIL